MELGRLKSSLEDCQSVTWPESVDTTSHQTECPLNKTGHRPSDTLTQPVRFCKSLPLGQTLRVLAPHSLLTYLVKPPTSFFVRASFIFTSKCSDDIERIQRRALRIAYPSLESDDIQEMLKLPSLHDRRDDMCRKLFVEMQSPPHKLHHLLPTERSSVTRDTKKYQVPKCRTERYKQSLIPWCLFNAQ